MTVSSESELRAALESDDPNWIVFGADGVITFEEVIEARSNKTIDGRGKDVTLRGKLRIRDAHNIIITDVKLTNDLEGHCTQDGDVLSISGTGGQSESDYSVHHLWIHRTEIFNGGDGLLDIRGATNVTVSWSHFHTHKKGLLVSDPDDVPAPGAMRVTMHHNLFDRITLRGPQLVGGAMHYFNNYQHQFYEYGAGSLGGAQFLSENNIYEAREGRFCFSDCQDPNPCGDNDFQVSKDALVTYWTEGNGTGFAKSVGDVAWNDAELAVNEPDNVVIDPPRPASMDDAGEELAQLLLDETGPRTSYCE